MYFNNFVVTVNVLLKSVYTYEINFLYLLNIFSFIVIIIIKITIGINISLCINLLYIT